MIIYHVEAFDENYMQQGSFITTNFENALKAGKEMYEQQDAEVVYLNYWENEHVIKVKVINEEGKLAIEEDEEDN